MFSLTRQSYGVLALLSVLSIMGNYYTLPLFFGVNFLFGSIAILLIIRLFGVSWGVIVAFIANSYTVLQWGYFYDLLLFTLEALFVGITWRRYYDNIILLEGIFWLIIGIPLIWVLYTYFTPLTSQQIILFSLKSFVNGIINATIVSLLVTHLPLHRWFAGTKASTCPSFQHILLNLIIAFMLLPELANMTINGWQLANKAKQDISSHLQTISTNISTYVNEIHEKHLTILQKLAQIIAQVLKPPIDESIDDKIQADALLMHSLFPEILEMVITDTNGHILFSSPQSSHPIHDILFPPENKFDFYMEEIGNACQSGLENSFTQQQLLTYQNQLTPVTTHAVQIRQTDNSASHILFIHLSLDIINLLHHVLYTEIRPINISVVDKKGIVINSTRDDLPLMQLYDHLTTNNEKEYIWFPPQTSMIPFSRWYQAVYIKRTPIDENTYLIIEIPFQSYLVKLQTSYVNRLALISAIVLCSLILALLVSRWLVIPLSRLSHATYNLPTRLEQNWVIEWPPCQVNEIDTLTNHFKIVSDSLQARFGEISNAKLLLEERVNHRTLELQHERALLRSLINAIPSLIFYKNTASIYLGCNKAAEAFLSTTEANVIGKNHYDLFVMDKADQYYRQDQQVLQTGIAHSFEEKANYPNGISVLFNSLTTPFFTPEGQLLGLITICHDVTAYKRSEEALSQSQAMLQLVIDNIPQCIFWKDQHEVYLGCNRNFAHMIGISVPNAIVGKTDISLLQNEHLNTAFFQAINQYIKADGQLEYQRTISLQLDDNKEIWLEISKIPLYDERHRIIGILGSFADISNRRRAEEKLRQTAKVLENSADAICITDASTRIIVVNKAFTKITGYQEQEVLGKQVNMLKSGVHERDFYHEMWRSITSKGEWEGEIWNKRKNGDIYPEWLHISMVKDQESKMITNYVAIFSDITLRKQTEQRLAYLAHYDELTGLPNRTLFYERLNRAIDHAHQQHHQVAVMFLDLDRFKFVNDTWGHAVGDLLLKDVAKRLRDCVRQNDTIARLGGDEFTAILENIADTKEVIEIAQRILNIAQTPFYLCGNETFMTTSIGISLYPNDGENVDTLLKYADAAMYRAKEGGKNNYEFFTAQMNTYAHQRLTLETQLRHALEREEFALYYQPQIHLSSGRIIGAESLLRWHRSQGELILPHTFIPLAEETGLIAEIGEWVLRQTCLQHQLWRNAGKPVLRMAVNISARQFKQTNLVEILTNIIEETKMDPCLLELELTESTLMQDADNAIKILTQFKEMGIQIAVDDFGTGYSSLNYLKRFPIDKLKIDQSFIRDIPKDKDDMAIVRAIIALARTLNLNVIAEGVETKEQLVFLKMLKCDEVQGYMFSEPLPHRDFIELLTS